MRTLLRHHHHQPLILRNSSAMASSLFLPAVSLRSLSFAASDRNAARGFGFKSFGRSRVSMSVSAGSQTLVDDALFADYKPSCAFLFPGQGAQAVGMGKEAQAVTVAADLFKKANEILGYDLLELCINGPKEKLDSTVISQPAIYVTSLAAVELLRARDGGQQIIDSVDVTCGLSLGEYTALAFAEAFSFEDGLKLVKLRGEAMQDAADAAKSAMVSVIGLDSEKVQQLCDAANQEVDEADKVQIANYLCPGNYAVSGGVKGVEAVEAKAKSFKARMTVRLAVAGAFHTSFMEPAVSRLEAALAATEIRSPRIPVISNVDAQPHADPATIKKILARQVTSPVQWETTVKTLLGCSPDDFTAEETVVNLCLDLGRKEVVVTVYGYWMNKRKQKGSSLLRVFQGYQPKETSLIPIPGLRKRRSFKREVSQFGGGKQPNLLQVMAAEQDALREHVAVLKVEEDRKASLGSLESAILKRYRAQMLMVNADLAAYKAVMAIRIAEAARVADPTVVAACLLD